MSQKFSSTSYYRNIRGIGISSSSIELLLTESCPSSTPPAKVALILLFFDPRDESPMLTELVWRKKEKRSSPRHDGSILRIFFSRRNTVNCCYNHSLVSYVELVAVKWTSRQKRIWRAAAVAISSRVWKRQKGAIVFLAARQEFYPQLSQKLNNLQPHECLGWRDMYPTNTKERRDY